MQVLENKIFNVQFFFSVDADMVSTSADQFSVQLVVFFLTLQAFFFNQFEMVACQTRKNIFTNHIKLEVLLQMTQIYVLYNQNEKYAIKLLTFQVLHAL